MAEVPERWQQVKLALEEALDLRGAARAAYLERIGAQDPALRTELESLLAADERAGSTFLERPAAAAIEAPRPVNHHAGRRLGPYRLVQEIGSGGMGEVYRALRADREYVQQVAIKLVRTGTDAEFVGQRLRTERQILAAFRHPNIAQLIDGGTTEDGVPYIVMELIEGRPIIEYCDQQRLGIEARLELFLKVCSAVQYAHQHAVIHRDLKPTNILVTAEGTPKLLDFGIAKIMEPGAIPTKPDATANALRILTPDYASPEQLSGGPVSAASDVYALGMILYELLTGLRPFRDGERVTGGRIKPVVALSPSRPSLAARRQETPIALAENSPQRLGRRLRGDLDNIIMMALRHGPERRYATVERFAEDIRRHREHLPVLARRPTLAYRARSFVVRHRVGVAATTLIVAALMAGIVMTTRATFVAREALARANEEAAASQRVTDYLVMLFDGANPDKTGGQALDVRALVARAQAEIDPQLLGEPLLRARMLTTVGTLYCEIGESRPCRQDLEQALKIEQSVRSTLDPLLLARTEYRLASAYNSAGRSDEALELLRKALPAFEAEQPPETHALAGIWNEIGNAYIETKPLSAIAALQRARALERGSDGEDTVASAATLGALAIANAQALRFKEALALAGTRVALVKQHFSATDVRYVEALDDYAEVAQEAARYDEADHAWRQVLDGYARIFGKDNDRYIDTELNLADVLFRRNQLRDSLQWFQRAVAGYRAQGNLRRDRFLGALEAVSQVLWMYGDYRGAASAAREADTLFSSMPGVTPLTRAIYRIRTAHTLAFIGEAPRAIALLAQPVPGDVRSSMVISFEGLRLLWLGDAYREAGRYAEAERSYDQAIAHFQVHPIPNSAAQSMAYHGKALLLAREDRFAQAVPLYRLAIASYLRIGYAPQGPTIAEARTELAASLLALGQREQARELIARAGPIVESELAPTHPARIMLARLRAALRSPGAAPPPAG